MTSRMFVYFIISAASLTVCNGSTESQLSSYLKGVFRAEANKDLNHFLISNASGTEYVYIGAVDTNFQLQTDLTHVRNDSTDTTAYCSTTSPTTDPCPLPTNENKILVYASPPVDRLILCRNSDGHCEFRRTADISREGGYIGVSNSKQVASPLLTVGIYIGGYLWVAASAGSSLVNNYLVPPISKRYIDQNYYYNVFTYESSLPGITSEITYLQEFIHGEFIYFVVLHERNADSPLSKLGRVCNTTKHYYLDAYAEITLACGTFNRIQTTHVLEDDVLYAIFTNDTNSALCSYTMTDIEEKFVDGTCGCASDNECSGLGRIIPYLQDDAECTNRVSARFLLVILQTQKLSEN